MTINHATTLKRQRRKQTIPTLYLSEAIKAEYQSHLVGMYSDHPDNTSAHFWTFLATHPTAA